MALDYLSLKSEEEKDKKEGGGERDGKEKKREKREEKKRAKRKGKPLLLLLLLLLLHLLIPALLRFLLFWPGGRLDVLPDLRPAKEGQHRSGRVLSSAELPKPCPTSPCSQASRKRWFRDCRSCFPHHQHLFDGSILILSRRSSGGLTKSSMSLRVK